MVMADGRKPVRRKPGSGDIKAGERDLERGVLGTRGYNLLKGAKDIEQGIKKDRRARRKEK